MAGPYKKGSKRGKHLVGVTKKECGVYVQVLQELKSLIQRGELSDVDKAAATIKKRQLIAFYA